MGSTPPDDPELPSDPRHVRASIRNFRRLVELEPHHRGHRERLARLYLADGRKRDAVREWLGLARDLLREGHWDDAVGYARLVLEVDPENSEAPLFLAELYARAPRNALRVGVVSSVLQDPLEELSGLDNSQAPMDASALVAVHSPDELGAELLSTGGTGDYADDDRSTIDLEMHENRATGTADLEETELFEVSPSMDSGSSSDPTATIDVNVHVSQKVEAAEPVEDDDVLSAEDSSVAATRNALPVIPLFSGLPRAALGEVARRAERRLFSAGTTLVEVGDPPEALYVVLHGQVRLELHHRGNAVVLGIVGQGEIIGDVELLHERPFEVEARALVEVEVLKLVSPTLSFLRRHYPALDRALEQMAEEHIVTRLLAGGPLFGSLTGAERTALARRLHPISLSPGEELFAEGAEPGGLYLVTQGSLEVYREGHAVTVLSPGDFAGLVAAMDQRTSRATVIAGPSAQVVCLDEEELELVLGGWPNVREAFWREAQARRDQE